VDYHQEAHEIIEALNDASPLLERRQDEKIKGYKTLGMIYFANAQEGVNYEGIIPLTSTHYTLLTVCEHIIYRCNVVYNE